MKLTISNTKGPTGKSFIAQFGLLIWFPVSGPGTSFYFWSIENRPFMFINGFFMVNGITGIQRSGQKMNKINSMKKICIPLVMVLCSLAIEVKAQTVVVTRPVRRVVVTPPPVKVTVVRPTRVVIAPRTVVVRPAPVVVYTKPLQRTVIVKKTVIYQ